MVLVGCSPAGPESIERFIEETVPAQSRGVVVAAQDGDLVFCDGWGLINDDGGAPMGCDTVVDIMSMTKQFTAAAILKLQMLGELDVSDPIGGHLDGVPQDKQAITVGHLLTHTSGLVEGLGEDDQPVTRADVISQALGSSLQSEPGTAYAYSNLGYSLLAAVIEIASGSEYEQFLADHLFDPAGMTSAGYVLPDWTRSTWRSSSTAPRRNCSSPACAKSPTTRTTATDGSSPTTTANPWPGTTEATNTPTASSHARLTDRRCCSGQPGHQSPGRLGLRGLRPRYHRRNPDEASLTAASSSGRQPQATVTACG